MSWAIDTLKGLALIAAFMVTSATCAYAGEHWVCSFLHKLEPARTVIMDYEVRGDKLLMDWIWRGISNYTER